MNKKCKELYNILKLRYFPLYKFRTNQQAFLKLFRLKKNDEKVDSQTDAFIQLSRSLNQMHYNISVTFVVFITITGYTDLSEMAGHKRNYAQPAVGRI